MESHEDIRGYIICTRLVVVDLRINTIFWQESPIYINALIGMRVICINLICNL